MRSTGPTIFLARAAAVLLLAHSLSTAPAAAARPAPPEPVVAGQQAASEARAAEVYGGLPMAFERNLGQTDARVEYVARGRGYAVFVERAGATLALGGTGTEDGPGAGAALRMEVVGAREGTAATGLAELGGRSHYFVGGDAQRWVAGAPTYGQVRVEGVYAGVDLALYGNQKHLEYDFVVAPGADPARIAVRFAGADAVEVDEAGDLVLRVGAREVRQQRARVYQETAEGRRSVPARYSVAGGVVRFDVGEYDRSRPLVVDPVLVFSSYLGGQLLDAAAYDEGVDVAIDAAGAAYVTGQTQAVNFPTTPGAFDRRPNDIFVTKLDASGSSLSWSFYLGSDQEDQVAGIAVDAAGATYLVGRTGMYDPTPFASTFPTTPGAYDTVHSRAWDVFVTKVDPSGSALVYSTLLGGSSRDFAGGVAVDASGAAYVAGWTEYSTSFPTTPGALDRTPDGPQDGFVAKLSPDGSALVYSTLLGGEAYDDCGAIAVDAAGAAYVAGTTSPLFEGQTSFPTTPGAFDTAANGETDSFVAKLSPDGSALAYSTLLGGADHDTVHDLALDGLGQAHVTGATRSLAPGSAFPTTPGAYRTTSTSFQEVFVAKVAASGASLAYSTFLGTGIGHGIAVHASGDAFVTGHAFGAFPATPGALGPFFEGGSGDAFVARLEVSGASLSYATHLGGDADDVGAAVAVDAAGNAFVTGYVQGSGYDPFPTTTGAFDPTFNGERDAFVAKVNASASALAYSTFLGGNRASGSESGQTIAVDAAGSIYVGGRTHSLDYPTTPGAYDPAFEDAYDGELFLTKLGPGGDAIVYSTFFGGSSQDFVREVAVDAAGNAYVTGVTYSSDFPTTPGAFDTSPDEYYDCYVLKLSASGSALAFSTFLGGSGPQSTYSTSIEVDAAGAVYLAGETGSTDFPTTPGAFDREHDGAELFVAKLDASGSALVYATLLGGSAADSLGDFTVDAAGAVYLTGEARSHDFPTTPGAFDSTHDTISSFYPDAFVAKLDPTGSQLAYGTFLGGSQSEEGLAIAVDADGAAYVAGGGGGLDFPFTPGTLRADNGPFLAKLDPSGSGLVYAGRVEAGWNWTVAGIALTATGRLWLAGSNAGYQFVATSGAIDATFNGERDAYALQVDAECTEVEYATLLGGEEEDEVADMAVDRTGAVYLVGTTASRYFPTERPYQAARAGFGDAFVAKISAVPAGDGVGAFNRAYGAWYLRDEHTSGLPDSAFFYGAAGSPLGPLAGDWDGDGRDTPGLYDPSTGAFFITNQLQGGPADAIFYFGVGGTGIAPLTGDWDGDGRDTVGLYVEATGVFFLTNSTANGPADVTFTFGPGGQGFAPMAGDWDGDGRDTVGLYAAATGGFFLRAENANGPADVAFSYGGGGFAPLAGDWDGDGRDTPGLYDPASATWYLRNENASGPADATFFFGPAGAEPLVGNWDGQ